MASILEKIKQEKDIKLSKITVKIPSDLKGRIEYICKNSGVTVDKYLGEILINSEINRVYKALEKEKESSSFESNVETVYTPGDDASETIA